MLQTKKIEIQKWNKRKEEEALYGKLHFEYMEEWLYESEFF